MSQIGWVMACLVATSIVASPSRGLAQQGPALNSFYLNVKPTDGECCANVTFAQKLPPERKAPPTALSMERTGKGLYTVTAPAAAPFPGLSPRSGFFVAVTAVASNAHCFEKSTLVKGGRDLVATVGCVDPGGAPVDSQFSWSYRADSFDYPQHTPFKANFGYAHVQPDGRLGSFFTPARGGGVTARKLGSGRFRVDFPHLGSATAELDRKVGVDLLVSNVCAGGGPCGRQVCAPASWSVGAGASTVDIRCSDQTGAAVDGQFRVFIGQEALNSQSFGKFENPADYKKYHQRYNEGTNYGWVNSSDASATTGAAPVAKPAIEYMNKGKDFPGPRKIDYFHQATGVYSVIFKDQIIYGQTYWSMHATTRDSDGGAYCNVGEIDYKKAQISVNCYDGHGNPRDAKWFLSMRRLYN